jgi:hypothetical protein
MFCTSAARLFHLTTQRFSRPMHADGGISRANSRLLRLVGELSVIEIDEAQRSRYCSQTLANRLRVRCGSGAAPPHAPESVITSLAGFAPPIPRGDHDN